MSEFMDRLLALPRELRRSADLRRAAGDDSAACAFEAVGYRIHEIFEEATAAAKADADAPEATLPPIYETQPDGSRVQIHPRRPGLSESQRNLAVALFRALDLETSESVRIGFFHPDTALAVMTVFAQIAARMDARIAPMEPEETRAAAGRLAR